MVYNVVNAGVSVYNGESFQNFNTNDGLPSNRVWSVFEDSSGRLWFATDTGVAVGVYQPSQNVQAINRKYENASVFLNTEGINQGDQTDEKDFFNTSLYFSIIILFAIPFLFAGCVKKEITRIADWQTHFTDIHFADAKHGWIVGHQGWILHTADGGVSWEKQTVNTNEDFKAVYFHKSAATVGQ